MEERRGRVLKRKIYETNDPNDVYHIDGNDKLKKWGFYIHGGVDGFSRKVLWMTVSSTNSDPHLGRGGARKLPTGGLMLPTRGLITTLLPGP